MAEAPLRTGIVIEALDGLFFRDGRPFEPGTHCRSGLAEWIASHCLADAATSERIRKHLAVLSDNDFTHFVRHATEVVSRIGLDTTTKTIRQGSLFYQELRRRRRARRMRKAP